MSERIKYQGAEREPVTYMDPEDIAAKKIAICRWNRSNEF